MNEVFELPHLTNLKETVTEQNFSQNGHAPLRRICAEQTSVKFEKEHA